METHDFTFWLLNNISKAAPEFFQQKWTKEVLTSITDSNLNPAVNKQFDFVFCEHNINGNKNYIWDEIASNIGATAKQNLLENIVLPIMFPQLFRYPPRAVFLFGPNGAGKENAIRCFGAQHGNLNFGSNWKQFHQMIQVDFNDEIWHQDTKDFNSKKYGKDLHLLFYYAKLISPCIIYFKNMDKLEHKLHLDLRLQFCNEMYQLGEYNRSGANKDGFVKYNKKIQDNCNMIQDTIRNFVEKYVWFHCIHDNDSNNTDNNETNSDTMGILKYFIVDLQKIISQYLMIPDFGRVYVFAGAENPWDLDPVFRKRFAVRLHAKLPNQDRIEHVLETQLMPVLESNMNDNGNDNQSVGKIDDMTDCNHRDNDSDKRLRKELANKMHNDIRMAYFEIVTFIDRCEELKYTRLQECLQLLNKEYYKDNVCVPNVTDKYLLRLKEWQNDFTAYPSD